MKANSIIIVQREVLSPAKIKRDTKIISCWNGRYHRGVETDEYVYFCNYQECDDNASVKMYSKTTLELLSDNYHAFNHLVGVILEKSHTYLSYSMKFNASEMRKQNA